MKIDMKVKAHTTHFRNAGVGSCSLVARIGGVSVCSCNHVYIFICQFIQLSITASPKVLKIFSHPQTQDQSQVVQNDKLSQESVETKIFVGGNGTFSHFFEKKLKKMWKKNSKKIFFFTKICFSELEKAYVQLFVLNFFFV